MNETRATLSRPIAGAVGRRGPLGAAFAPRLA
jgi:hypothetical protein